MNGIDRPDLTLEPDPRVLRAWVDAAMDRIVHHVTTLPDQPCGYAPEQLPAWSSSAEFPREGTELEHLLDQIFDVAAPASYNTASPGYMAYIPGGGLLHSAVADLIAASINRYVGVWIAAPLLAAIEVEVIQWFCAMMGLPPDSRGLLTTGGSMANFTALVTARHQRLGEDFHDGVIYASDQVHHSVLKAAVLAGFARRRVVLLASDATWRLRPKALQERIARDRAAGLRPFLLVASAGTTNTGAVDPLPELAGICRKEGLWLHVDAAYGGFFRLTEEGRRVLPGTDKADSITLDPHKGLFLPYGTGALLVRDGAALRQAHSVSADYMPALQVDSGGQAYDFCESGPELSRGFRGLRVWLPIRLHGVGPFVRNLEEKLALTRHATERLRRIEGIEVVAKPQLSVVAFRFVREGLGDEEIDALNEELLARVLASGKVWLTSTRLNGRLVIRICVLSFRTHRDRVDLCVDLIEREAARL